jgi:G-protein signaling modulator 2
MQVRQKKEKTTLKTMMHKLSLSELASEGERLCKSGDCSNGIKYFEEALLVYDKQYEENNLNEEENFKLLQTMAIIYNQMGNAYFNLQDYSKALEYHKKDLQLSEQFGDEPGRAKACGNVGNALQLLGDYDEAILYLLRNLDISKKLNDSSGEARALYNLANIYQSKGKFMGRLAYHDDRDPNSGEFSNEIKDVLMKAVYYYRETLRLVSTKDRAAEGRTYGNLGNTYYFLGDFESAIECHNQRLKIAKEYGDKPAERRAFSNLGNAHIFQGMFNEAADYYLKAMNVARILGDKAIEAQSYYSLGNAYILLQDYSVAIDFHLRHLQIAQSLEDKIGESRAFWSLGNAYAALGDLENAIMYANRHLNLARIIGDSTSELTAKKNLYDFQNLLSNSGFRDSESGLFTPVCSKYGRKYFDKQTNSLHKSASIDSFYNNTAAAATTTAATTTTAAPSHISEPYQINNGDCPTSDLTYQRKNLNFSLSNSDIENKSSGDSNSNNKEEELSFFEVLSRIQSNRLDDQRCSIKRIAVKQTSAPFSQEIQRIHAQVTTDNINSKTSQTNLAGRLGSTMPNDDFFNLIIKSQQTRLEDQRTSLAHKSKSASNSSSSSTSSSSSSSSSNSIDNNLVIKSSHIITSTATSSSSSLTHSVKNLDENNKEIKHFKPLNVNNKRQAITVPPDDEFFSMIQKIQSRRLDEQRTSIKPSMFNLKRNPQLRSQQILP